MEKHRTTCSYESFFTNASANGSFYHSGGLDNINTSSTEAESCLKS